jgi:alpha-tubulin suppressor-like RCC1 family protein
MLRMFRARTATRRAALLMCVAAGCADQPPRAASPGPASASARVVESSAAEQPAPPRLAQLAAAGRSTCVIRGGKVLCFGNPVGGGAFPVDEAASHRLRAVDGIDDATAITLGLDHGCALRRGGTVACWGVVDDGRMGATAERAYKPRVVTAAETVTGLAATQVSAGAGFSCAVRADATVACWGMNAHGELGDGSSSGSLVPRELPGLDDALEVSAGRTGACVRRRSGEVWCWGARPPNPDAATPKTWLPHAVTALSNVRRVAMNGERLCVLRSGGSVVVSTLAAPRAEGGAPLGAVDFACGGNFVCGVRADDTAACSGYSDHGQLGTGDHEQFPTRPVHGLSDVRELAAGDSHVCALLRSGEVRCWGLNDAGQLGFDNARRIATPSPVLGLDDATRVAVGDSTSCVVRRTGAVACWGGDDEGALGRGGPDPDATVDESDSPSPVAVSDIADANDIASGGGHFCVVRRSGKVSCWGRGSSGQLGAGDTQEHSTPVEVPGLDDAVDVDASDSCTCVARKSGTVACWGAAPRAGREQMGGADGGRYPSIPGLRDVARVAVTNAFGCAVRRDGTAACWGADPGRDETRGGASNGVAEVRGARDLVQIAVGAQSLALSRSGRVRTVDLEGVFSTTRGSPAPLASRPWLEDARSLARCSDGGCLVRRSGEVACRGADGKGVTFGFTDAVDVETNGQGTFCVVRKSGVVACWGGNEHGEAGVTTHRFALVPVTVAGML